MKFSDPKFFIASKHPRVPLTDEQLKDIFEYYKAKYQQGKNDFLGIFKHSKKAKAE